MPASPFFSGRIPQELLDAVEKHRALTGESKTDVLVRSLAKYVGYELPEVEVTEPPIRSQIDKILKRLEAVETELGKSKQTSIQSPSPDKEQLGLQLDNSQITKDNENEPTASYLRIPYDFRPMRNFSMDKRLQTGGCDVL